MQGHHFSEIAGVTGVQPLQQAADPLVEYLLTDSRKLLHPDSTMFFAISSDHKNAHDFVKPLYDDGVRCFVVTNQLSQYALENMPGACIIMVQNVLKTLQDIASFHRSIFDLPVIGITGSNGKTIVKEWLNQVLLPFHNIVRSPKSYNSQVGVPLSVWNIRQDHTLGIFEAGISTRNEMSQLERIIRPSIGVLTFIGEAHAAGFESREEKIREKLKLFRNSKVLIYGADDQGVFEEVKHFREENRDIELVSWGSDLHCSLKINETERTVSGTIINCSWKLEPLMLEVPFMDDASLNNVLTTCTILLYMGIPDETIVSSLKQLRPVHMRLELKQGINHCSVINDSYSSDLNSLLIALDFLQHQQQHPIKTIILSDIPQSALSSEDLYGAISSALVQRKINRIIGVGPEITAYQLEFQRIPEKSFFLSTEAFLANFPTLKFREEIILLKGARAFQFERISQLLEHKRHETILEIDLNAIRNNLAVYRSLMKPGVKLMAMVKAAGYGSGSSEIAGIMEHSGVNYLSVAYTDEGVELRQKGIRLPVMVMNTEEAAFDTLTSYKLEPEIYSFNILNSFITYLEENETEEYPVHIKMDTGMHRLGFSADDMDELGNILRNSKRIRVQSVFSHLAASDDETHDAFTHEQATTFLNSVSKLEENLGYPFLKHLANTSAIHRHPDLQLDMVRLGIGLYGYDSNADVQRRLRNVTTLRTSISQLKTVKAGESVGYSRRAVLDKDTVIATVRVGYADGYLRSLSNGKGNMMVNGKFAPVVGNICMDMTMLDVTGIDVKEGEEVIVFGEGLPVSDVAEWAGTIPYEILTSISQRVKRVYFEE